MPNAKPNIERERKVKTKNIFYITKQIPLSVSLSLSRSPLHFEFLLTYGTASKKVNKNAGAFSSVKDAAH